MKKTLFVLTLLWITLLFAASADNVSGQVVRAFSIGSRNASQMDLKFVLPSYEVKNESILGVQYNKIYMDGAEFLAEDGMPELPVLSTTIAIPHRGGVQVEVLNSSQQVIQQFYPVPVQAGLETIVPKAVAHDVDFYNGGGVYPLQSMMYGEPAILRDLRIMTININPFSWNAASGELIVNTEMDIRISFTDTPGLNELAEAPSYISPSFVKLYEGLILNFDDYRAGIFANTPPRYLIIYGNNTDQTFLNKLDEYAFWKRQKGADVNVVSTSVAGTSNSAIKTYIQNQYNNVNTRPDFVILIGDTSGSYTIPTFTNGSFPGDYPYTHLAGSDGLGDVFIGRISAENLSQFETIMAKGYAYEKNINIAQADWLDRMLLVGDWAPSGISTMYLSKYVKEISTYVNPNYTYTELYSADPSPAAMNAATNQGIGLFHYRGYLGMSGWSPSESSLFNGNKLPHAVIITCGTGNFNGGTGTTEAFIRLGTAAAPKGAVTAIGMATSSTHTSFNNTLNGGIVNGIYTQGMRTMGEALLNGKIYLHQIYGVSSPSDAVNFAMMGNLMGDPTLEYWTGIPGEFSMTVQQNIPVGLSLLDIAISQNGNPIEGACITLSQGTSILARGYTDVEGNVILVLPETMTAGDGVITVSKHNFKPLQQTIPIVNTGTLVPGNIVIDDDNTAPSSGNANGVAGAGETLEVLFGLRNTGTSPLSGISGYVTTDSPYVSFADSLVVYPTTAGGALSFNQTPVVMSIAPDTPHTATLRLHLMLTDSMGTNYDVSEFMSVESAKLRFMSYQVADGGNSALDPNESSSFYITLQNNGTILANDLQARLFSLNDLVSVTDHHGSFGNIAPNGLGATTTDNFVLTARPEILPGMVIPMRLKLYNDNGFLQYVDFSLTIGVVTVNDPLGPDTYGYVIYGDNDTAYPQAPTYSWVEIAPSLGGQGVALPISDVYVSSNEGDQVGATSLAVVNLPFPFQFYGRTYEQITVCSNGFIALGVTENAEFRNFRLPGAMGPNPMIAAFWDDLATHSGSGIYTWFDRNNHSFVIQWHNMKNGYNGSSEETFQIILYDQAVYPTSLGDGPIKIQYKVFNNVNAQSGNRHGCFSTIGIVDHTGLVGLEYTFNNQYPTAAQTLGNLRALYITNIPVYYEAANLIIGETYIDDTNGNRVVEPGERVRLGIQLANSGNALASNIVSTLAVDDPYITLINGVSNYYPLAGEATGVNQSAFVFDVSPECPDGRIITFTLTITSGENVWERTFSIRVDAAKLQYHSYLVSDYDATFDGIIDGGESVKVVINLKNAADVVARDIVGTLSTTNPFVDIANGTVSVATVPANGIMQLVYNVTFNSGITPNTYVPFSFEASSSNGTDISTPINIPFQMPGMFYDFELDAGNFVAETGWQWGTPAQVTPYSGSKAWATGLSGNYPEYVEFNLYTPVYVLTTNPTLSFRHYYGIENNYDGANVSISTNGGTTWTVITPNGGYTHNSLPGINGQPGYSGQTTSWQQATFNLNSYAGMEAMFRFKFGSDGQVNSIGWFIDNVQLNGISNKIGFMYGEVIPTSGMSPSLSNVITHNGFATHPANDGMYRIYLRNGHYAANAYMEHHQSSSNNNIVITAQNITRQADFTLIHLPKPLTIDFNVNNDTGLLNVFWSEPYDPVLPVVGYKIYKKFNAGAFQMVAETTNLFYNETLALEGEYKYYVVVKYINADGAPSDILNIPFPYLVGGSEIPWLVTMLKANYPNPFNPTTSIAFDLAKTQAISLKIYNVKGQLVRTLISGNQNAGRHQIQWNGKDEQNRNVSSGVYFYKLETKDYQSTRKMLMIK